MTENVTVEVGQLWVDNDPRVTPTRFVRVLDIQDEKAVCESWYIRPSFRSTGMRKVRISLARFRPTSTGYRPATAQEIAEEASYAVS